MPEDNLDNTQQQATQPAAQPKYTDEEIAKILNTAQATRKEKEESEKRFKEAQDRLKQLEGLDPQKFKELEDKVKTYQQTKLEEQQKYEEVKSIWQNERQTLQQQINDLALQKEKLSIEYKLEKAFSACDGKTGKGDTGISYFDMIKPIAERFIQSKDGQISIIDPRDGTELRNEKGQPFTLEELMLKLRSGGPTADLFNPVGNGAGTGMKPSAGKFGRAALEEQLKNLPAAERINKARELGIA